MTMDNIQRIDLPRSDEADIGLGCAGVFCGGGFFFFVHRFVVM